MARGKHEKKRVLSSSRAVSVIEREPNKPENDSGSAGRRVPKPLTAIMCLALVCIIIWGAFVYSPTPFITRWREYFISSAMSTFRHQWLATALMPSSVIDGVMKEAEEEWKQNEIDKSEAKEILEMSYGYNLVQMGENVREHPAFMCNCCGCCCEALEAVRRFSPMQPIATTNYLPHINQETCVSCGKCAKVCPILAISMEENAPMTGVAKYSPAEDAGQAAPTADTAQSASAAGAEQAAPTAGTAQSAPSPGASKKRPVIDTTICLGCGVCARNCPKKAITLQRRPIEVITPVNSTHRFVLQAIEKGTLQNLVFDNQAFANHRAMAAVFGTILKLPPLKQALASKQFKSVYLDNLLSRQKKETLQN